MFRKGFLIFSAIMTVLSFTVLSLALTALFYNPTDDGEDLPEDSAIYIFLEKLPMEEGVYTRTFNELTALLPEQGEKLIFPLRYEGDLFPKDRPGASLDWFTMPVGASYMLKKETPETDGYDAYKITLYDIVGAVETETNRVYYYQNRPEFDIYLLKDEPMDEPAYSYDYSFKARMFVAYHAMPESMFTDRVFEATKYISFDKNDYNKETLVNAAEEGTPYTDMYNIMWEDIAVEGVDAQMFLVLFVTRGVEENKDVFEFKCYSTFVLEGFRYFISVDMISYYGDINKLNLNQSDYGKVKEFARYYQEKYLEKLLQTE